MTDFCETCGTPIPEGSGYWSDELEAEVCDACETGAQHCAAARERVENSTKDRGCF